MQVLTRATSRLRITLALLPIVACSSEHFPEPDYEAPTRPFTDGDWFSNGRDLFASRFSPLTDVTPKNVATLERAWTFIPDEDLIENAGHVFECTPLVVDGTVYILTTLQQVFAVDGVTGKEIWRYDPGFTLEDHRATNPASRGLAYWRRGTAERVIVPVRDARLISLDAATGKPDPHFGDAGAVDLRKLLELNSPAYSLTSPPIVYKDLLILGGSVADQAKRSPYVPVVALSARTGEHVWTFDTIPREGEFGAETWEGDSWKDRGGCNVWTQMSVDEVEGIVYLPVSSPTFDLYGGDRPGANLFANCVVAVNGDTGERIWHYQTIHHDIWDYDLPAAPNLVDLQINGKTIKAVAQVGKTGFVYVLNRLTGEPIFPIEERPVPQSDVPGEQTWPTQPFPTRPPAFSRQGLREEQVQSFFDERAQLLDRFKSYRSDGLFTPLSLNGSLIVPSFHGGANWSGAAVDLNRQVMFLNTKEIVSFAQLIENPGGDFRYREVRYRFEDSHGYPAVEPPWGQLTAIDLNAGEILWQRPLGEYQALTEKGFPPTGMENFGGTSVTASGLVFVAATPDGMFRAFDATDGSVLWETELDTAAYAAPAVYRGDDGKQYVIICAGGGSSFEPPNLTEIGLYVIAFALPDI